VQNEKGMVEISAIEDLKKLHPQFEATAQVFPDYRGPLFKGQELGNFELLRSFPAANAGVPLAPKIRDLLKLKQGGDVFPGAYAPRD